MKKKANKIKIKMKIDLHFEKLQCKIERAIAMNEADYYLGVALAS